MTRSRTSAQQVCPESHKHGQTSTCLNRHHCTCNHCHDGLRARENAKRRQKAYGTYLNPLVPAGPTRGKILELMMWHGYGHRSISAATGVSRTFVRRLIDGHAGQITQRVTRSNEARILAFDPTTTQPLGGARIDARGTRRRLQALMWMGWSLPKLSTRCGIHVDVLRYNLHAERVNVTTRNRVAALYETMWTLTPEATTKVEKFSRTKTHRFAVKNGWLSPLAWDDIDHDETPDLGTPTSRPSVDDIAVELALLGETIALNSEERKEVVRRLPLHPEKEVARIAGISKKRVYDIRREVAA